MPEFKLHEAFTRKEGEGGDGGGASSGEANGSNEAASAKPSTSESDVYKKKGNEAFGKQDWDEAIKNYNKAITLDPSQPALYSNRAACWSCKGKHESALTDANRCIEKDPSFVKGYSRKAKALFDLGRWDDSESSYQEGLVIDSNNAACNAGLIDIQTARARKKAKKKSSASSFPDIGKIGKGLVDKMKNGGMGGKMQMYMLAMGGYLLFQNFMGGRSKGKGGASSESSPGMQNDEDGEMPATQMARGFADLAGNWHSYLEARSGASETTLLLLHATSASAAIDFGAAFAPILEQATPRSRHGGGGLRVVAPDRPCHGFSPCAGTDSGKWLDALLAKRGAGPSFAAVAHGRTASQQVLSLVRRRKEAANIILLSPNAVADARPGLETTGDVREWLSGQAQASTPASAVADRVRWALAPGPAVEGEKSLEAEKLPKGSTVTLLYKDGEAVSDSLATALESKGVTTKVISLDADDVLPERLASELKALLVDEDDPRHERADEHEEQ